MKPTWVKNGFNDMIEMVYHIHFIILSWCLQIVIHLCSLDDIYPRNDYTQIIPLLLQRCKIDPSHLIPHSLQSIFMYSCCDWMCASISMVTLWNSIMVVTEIYGQCFICIVINMLVPYFSGIPCISKVTVGNTFEACTFV